MPSPLIQQMNHLPVPPSCLAIWSLGQAGIAIKASGAGILYIDPYLSDRTERISQGVWLRSFPPPCLPEEVTNAVAVLGTHDHADHIDPETVWPIAQASPNASFLVPLQAVDSLINAGIPQARVLTPAVHEPVQIDRYTIEAIPAAHYDLVHDDAGHYAAVGYLVHVDGLTLYHGGDTILYPGLAETLQAKHPDIMLLPVNGRDGWREQRYDCIGNLLPREAVELTKVVGASTLIPLHNDLFEINRINPAELTDYVDKYHRTLRVHWLQSGEAYLYIPSAT